VEGINPKIVQNEKAEVRRFRLFPYQGTNAKGAGMQTRGLVGSFLTFLFLVIFQGYLVKSAQLRATKAGSNRAVKFMDLIITSEDENYSLSRLQIYLWTFFIIIGFAAVFASTGKLPDIPANLYLLMGVNLTSAVASTAIATHKGVTKDGNPPDFIKDIFFESDDSLDLPRTQMFVWTMVSLAAFTVMLIKNYSSGNPILPDITPGLVALMGLSNGAYLGAKAGTK
jgi:hypothetical protein